MCILDISFPRHGGNKAPKSQICPVYVFTLQTIYLKRRLQNRTHHLWLPASPFLWVFIVCESCRWKQDFMRTLLVHVLTRPTDRHIFRRSDVPAVFTCRHLCMGCICSVLCLYLNAVRRVLFFTLCGYYCSCWCVCVCVWVTPVMLVDTSRLPGPQRKRWEFQVSARPRRWI